MSIASELQLAGEVLSPAVMAALDFLEGRTHLQDKRILVLEEENRTLQDRIRELEGAPEVGTRGRHQVVELP